MRLILVAHAVVGAAVVAALTHLALWLRPGRPLRWRGVKWLAAAGAILSVGQFVLGNVLYPDYKLDVRVAFFEDPVAVSGEAMLRAESQARARDAWLGEHDTDTEPLVPPARQIPLRADLSSVSRAFDIKEHMASLSLALSLATCLLAFTLDPKQREQRSGVLLLFGFSLLAAVGAWAAGLLGLWTTSFRAVGSL